jgi:hypothetical protein
VTKMTYLCDWNVKEVVRRSPSFIQSRRKGTGPDNQYNVSACSESTADHVNNERFAMTRLSFEEQWIFTWLPTVGVCVGSNVHDIKHVLLFLCHRRVPCLCVCSKLLRSASVSLQL